MIEAQFSSASYEFTAYGKTKSDASKLLLAALAKHGRHYLLPKRWYTETHEKDSEFIKSEVSFRKIECGYAFRDGGRII
jgi:hypothetical protein